MNINHADITRFPSLADSTEIFWGQLGELNRAPIPTGEGPARDDRPPSAMKRSREWEADAPSKKLANEESRARLDDPIRRNSPPGRLPTPKDHFRRSSSEIRREQERRANENYHPSEAAHHPYSRPPQQIPSMQSILDAPNKDDRKEHIEQAAIDRIKKHPQRAESKSTPPQRAHPHYTVSKDCSKPADIRRAEHLSAILSGSKGPLRTVATSQRLRTGDS